MKQITAILLFLLTFQSGAQEFTDPDLQSLVEAERAFIRMAREKNTRDAFLSFLADSAVTFGETARKGKKFFEEQNPNESLLHWEPVYTDIAASKDFGFNTGPWEFRPKKTDDKAVAFGHFVTVWKKNSRGEWRALIDIGIDHPEPKEKFALTISAIKLSKATRGSGKKEVFQLEKDFITSFSKEKPGAYARCLSREARIYRRGNEPYTKPGEIAKILSDSPDLTFTAIDGDIASSNDLAYVYGTATLDFMKDGQLQKKQSNYMRIWKKEDGKNWKIVLDILN